MVEIRDVVLFFCHIYCSSTICWKIIILFPFNYLGSFVKNKYIDHINGGLLLDCFVPLIVMFILVPPALPACRWLCSECWSRAVWAAPRVLFRSVFSILSPSSLCINGIISLSVSARILISGIFHSLYWSAFPSGVIFPAAWGISLKIFLVQVWRWKRSYKKKIRPMSFIKQV